MKHRKVPCPHCGEPMQRIADLCRTCWLRSHPRAPNTGVRRSEAERFWEKVSPEPTSGCWLWAAAYTTWYGTFMRSNQRQENAHRVAWELHHGRKIPEGMLACHRCDNPGCVNPAHLFLGTYRDNEWDKIRKGRKRYRFPHASGLGPTIVPPARRSLSRIRTLAKRLRAYDAGLADRLTGWLDEVAP